MRKEIWSAAAAAALLAVALPALVGPPARAADTRVQAGSSSEQLKFLPADITVPVGTTVIWINESDVPHDVSADDGSFDSKGTFDKGKEYRFTFTKEGKFPYVCTPHKDAGMKGTVTVAGGGGGATPTTAASSTTATTAAPGATTTTTRAGASSSTTATSSPAQAGESTTTTTAGLGVTSTTQAAATTPTSAPETGGVTETTEGEDSHGDEEAAAAGSHGSGGSDKKTNALAVALAGVLTVLLAAISLKLLTAKA